MEQRTETATAGTAYGQKLETPLEYSYSYMAYTSIDEVKAAGDMLSDAEVLKIRNDQRANNSRNKELVATLTRAGFTKPDINNNDQFRLREFHKVLMSSGKYTDEAARALAATTLGVDWA